MGCPRLMGIVLIAGMGLACSVAVDGAEQRETFLLKEQPSPKKKRMSSNQCKRALGDELEQLAHSLLKEIHILSQAEHELLLRISELLNDDSAGLLSSKSGKELETTLAEVYQLRSSSQQRCDDLGKLSSFITKKQNVQSK